MKKKLNPENICAHLNVKDDDSPNKLEIMMKMQSELQKTYYAKYLKDFGEVQKISQSKEMILCIIDELMEFMERLPWKHWRSYHCDAYSPKPKEKKEIQMELIDLWHFFMNLCELWGLDPKTFYNMYVAKNKENFDRIKRGYARKNIKL